jgi:hypothetical protein
MSSKLVLDTAAMQEDFFADTALIGIACALPAYRFCWLINQKLDMNFVREPESDLVSQTSASKMQYFSIYQYHLPLQGGKHSIYKLKSEKEALLPEVKQLDYLWMIQTTTPEADAELIIQHLRNLTDIQLAQILSPDKIKNLGHLLL